MARGCLGSVQNGQGSHRKHPKRFGDNSLEATWEHLNRPGGDTGAFRMS